MTKKTSPTRKLTLHSFLTAVSFWGTATRTMLFSILAFTAFIVGLSETTTPAQSDDAILKFIYVVSSFVLLDFGYVMVARAYVLKKTLDVGALLLVDTLLMMLYIVPQVVVSKNVVVRVDPLTYIVFIVLLMISGRLLLGILFGKRR